MNEKIYELYVKEYESLFNQNYDYEEKIIYGSGFKTLDDFIKYEKKEAGLIKKN